ncbi:hypothetical protein GCM10009592_08860 [Brachybacterium rhamnosum]|uniref:Uncharacterized protein n=1 Tax=Brachybacterium rhamnosum TaxID=173361 RepID=A0ABW4PUM5_9MICO
MIDDEHPLLTALTGQWVEAADPAPQPVLVTSRAAVLHGDLRGPSGAPTRDDARVLGAFVTSSVLAADGTLTLLLADADGGRPMPLAVAAPWGLALPDGSALAAAEDGRIGVRPGDPAPRFATPAAMAAWAASDPDEVELAVLEAGLDDWVTPGDVVAELVERDVRDPREIARHGAAALARLVARGDLEAGSIGEQGFTPAAEGRSASIEHVAALWHTLGGIGRRPGPGQIAWFAITDRGRSRVAVSR